MKDNLKNYLTRFPENHRLNYLREYLQWLILKSIDEQGVRKLLAFTGGTALRIVYGSGRFSEDLDFSLATSQSLDMPVLARNLCRSMERSGLDAILYCLRSEGTVGSFFLRFRNLLMPLGLSSHVDQTLSIKVEVDLRPPSGGTLEEYIFREPFLFWITHFGLPSLFSTKLHAFLYRKYVKGRDYYDLVFYLRKGVHPVLDLFRNAVYQTHPGERFPSEMSIFEAVAERVRRIDIDHVRRDLIPFLLDPQEERFITRETVIHLLKQGDYIA